MFCAIFSYDKISCSQGSLSHFLFTEKSTIKDWEIVLIAAATIIFFLIVAIGVLAVSMLLIFLHFCNAYLNHNWQFVTHSKSNDWELYWRVIYTGEVRERQKVFERKVVGKNVNFQFVSWARKFLLSSWWVGCRNMMAHGMAPTYFYHANDWKLSRRVIATKTLRHTGCVVCCLRVARAFFSLTLLYLNRWNTETLNRVKGRNCMPLMENGN